MELLEQNYINTSTQLAVNDNTATAGNVFLRDTRFQYYSDVLNDDNTTCTMTINFDSTTTVNRLAIVDHNLKAFTIFYNGSTASTISLDATQNTTTSDYSSNSDTSHYFKFATISCISITIDMKSTIVANNNKYIGYLLASSVKTDFDGRIPSAQQYNPVITPTNVIHRLSDGGIRIQNIDKKRKAKIGFDFITTATRDTLKEIYDQQLEVVFCPFGTSSGWDEFIFPCVWEGDFDFYRYSDNASQAGFSGTLTLLETPE